MTRPTLVIPHRSRRDLLERLLRAVEGWPVVVVDDSDDGCELGTVRLGGGQGFAKAANAGLAAARTPNAIVLNDDALPEGDCLDRLAAAGGLCGPVLVGRQGIESSGIAVSRWGRVVQRTDEPPDDRDVDALSGACLHLPSDARFDERFRHGCEDVDLCRRLGGARLIAKARCWHEGGATLDRRSPEATRHAVAGRLRLVEPGWREAVVVGLALAQVAREGGGGRIGAIIAGWQDSARGR